MSKFEFCLCVVFVGMFPQDGAFADNKYDCKWWDTFESGFRNFNVSLPASVKLKEGPVGSVLFASSSYYVSDVPSGCGDGMPSTERVDLTSGMQLADGFSDVYKTGVPGVGIRFSLLVRRGPRQYVPFEFKHPSNGIIPWGSMIYEFVRTDAVLKSGVANINATFQHLVRGSWHSSDLTVSGSVNIENERRITSCVNVGDTLIRMGRVDASEIGKKAGREFMLQARCNHEGTPGQPLPVSVYFEGDSPGMGRLNLVPGGAQGVELSLTDDSGKPLPFSKANALNMTSPGSTSGNYTLRVNAQYVKNPSLNIIPGQANAALNFIFEYN